MLNKEELANLLAVKGNVKGVTFQTDCDYVKRKWGLDGYNKLNENLVKFNYPINYEQIKTYDTLPIGTRVVSLLAIKETFNLSDEEIKEMGNTAPKISFILKIMMWAFVSPKTVVDKAPEFWEKHFSGIGKISSEFFGAEKYALIHLKEVKLHPIYCKYLEGYFQRIMQMAVKGEVTCKEVKCPFRGDPYHTYKVTWT